MKLQMILAVLNAIYATALRSLKKFPGDDFSHEASRVRSKSIMKSNCWFKYFGEKKRTKFMYLEHEFGFIKRVDEG